LIDEARIAQSRTGSQKSRTCLVGCMIAVGVCVILSAAGAWMIYRAAERLEARGGETLPSGITYQEAWSIGERFIGGLTDGSISPETGVRIATQLFIDAIDGVLTNDEIGSILEQMRRACGMRL
jgi:hypothetical protein